MLPARLAGATAQGALKLDNYTAGKVLAIPDYSFLVKVDTTYAYGEKEDYFKELCKLAHGVPNFFPAEIPVQEYGDKENDDIRTRLGLQKEDFPVYYLHNAANKEGLKYTGAITTEDIARWLRQHKISFPSVNTIEEMNVLVKKLFKESFADEHVQAAQKLAEGEYSADKKAGVYVKVMQKIKEKGADYVATETARVKKVLHGKVSPEKEAEMKAKLRILDVFSEKGEL
uniref:Endoplasmic reticulum resident protein 29 C-terminal domain-containing protein n=1 Tax=Alexandrium catenella TaxID=2925 RepID=A0A7S1WJA4_ALECA